MKWLFSVLALSSALLLATGIAWGRDLPWRTFTEARPFLSNLSSLPCPGGPAFGADYRHKNVVYSFFVGPWALLVLVDTNPDDPTRSETEFGVGAAATDDNIPALRWVPITPQTTTADLCRFLEQSSGSVT
mgnify:FL=1